MPSAVINKNEGTFVIPAAHTDRLQAILAGRQTAPVPVARIIQQIFSSDYGCVYNVPAPLIKKLSTSEKATRLVLCANYDAATDSCPCGDKCKFVHADTRTSTKSVVHNNYAWASLDAVTYERFDAGQMLEVAAPSTKELNGALLPSEMALKTKALESTRRPLSHCAHYFLNRTCNLGPECQFIHAVLIDADAKPHQRAPAPPKSTSLRASASSPRKNRATGLIETMDHSASDASFDILPPSLTIPAATSEGDSDTEFTNVASLESSALHRQWTDSSIIMSPSARVFDSPASSSAVCCEDDQSLPAYYVPAEGMPFDPLVAVMLYRSRPATATTTPSLSRRATMTVAGCATPCANYAPMLSSSTCVSLSGTPRASASGVAAASSYSTYGHGPAFTGH